MLEWVIILVSPDLRLSLGFKVICLYLGWGLRYLSLVFWIHFLGCIVLGRNEFWDKASGIIWHGIIITIIDLYIIIIDFMRII